MGVCQIPHE